MRITIPGYNTAQRQSVTIPGQMISIPPQTIEIEADVIPAYTLDVEDVAASASIVAPTGDFPTAVQAAFDADTCLNWTGGDFTLTAPVVLSATVNKLGFGIRLNGANVTCNFNDATKHAISVVVPIVGGHVVPSVNVRNFTMSDSKFRFGSPYAGALRFECRGTQSGIYSFTVNNIRWDGHSDRNLICGNVFEGTFRDCGSTNGGSFEARTAGPVDGHIEVASAANNWNPNANNPAVQDGDKGLPSALQFLDFRGRDATKDSFVTTATVLGMEPADITFNGGYFVTGQGRAIYALAGLNTVVDTGFENNTAECSIYTGYRGGKFIRVRGASPVAASVNAPNPYYLVRCDLSGNATNVLVFDDCAIQAEGPGGPVKLAKVNGGGVVQLNRSGTAADVDAGTGISVKVAQYG